MGRGDIFTQILQDIVERDQRDASRPVALSKVLPDARMVDTTDLSIDQAVKSRSFNSILANKFRILALPLLVG